MQLSISASLSVYLFICLAVDRFDNLECSFTCRTGTRRAEGIHAQRPLSGLKSSDIDSEKSADQVTVMHCPAAKDVGYGKESATNGTMNKLMPATSNT